MKAYAELSHDPAQDPGGYHATGVEVWDQMNAVVLPGDYAPECKWPVDAPKSVRLQVWKQMGPGDWGVCLDSGDRQYSANWRQELIRPYGALAPCGNGWYSTKGINYAWRLGAWRGGSINLRQWSDPGEHWLRDDDAVDDDGVSTPGGIPGDIEVIS